MMADSRPRPGNPDRGWNDPPMFSFNPMAGVQQPPQRRNLLNKRVAYPQTGLPVPGVAQQVNPDQGAAQPLSPVLLPPTSDISTPTPVPLLVPSITMPAPPPGTGGIGSGTADERMEDLLKRLHLTEDGELLQYTGDILGGVFNSYKNKIQERACDDIQKKLALLKDRWKSGSLTEPVRCKVALLATALHDGDIDKANHLHLALMVDHTAEVNQWMVGVKRLIQEQQKEKETSKLEDTEKEKEILAPSGDGNGDQASEGETTQVTADEKAATHTEQVKEHKTAEETAINSNSKENPSTEQSDATDQGL